MVISLIKTNEPQVQCLKTSRGEGSHTSLFRLIDSGLFYTNPLKTWGCRSCQYVNEYKE